LRDPKRFEPVAEILKALGHPARLCIISGLIEEEDGCNVTNMQECLGIPQSTVSQHLSVLKSKGILEGRRRGNEICYFIADKRIKKLLRYIMNEFDHGEDTRPFNLC
jgi:DNA-binding transcriptional ArsR family regulator